MYILKQADFITDTTPMYYDPEGNSPYKIRIESLPIIGVLKYSGVAATVGLILDYVTDIGAGKLTYEKNETITEGYSTEFDFRVADVGSGLYSNVGTITFNVNKTFSSPTVEDNSGILNSKVFTFSEGYFTNNFTDGDGDGYNEVIIETLPIVPSLKLLGENIAVGDRFLAVNSSGLKFNLPDNYAIYGGVLYKFSENLTKIISDYDALDYRLTENAAGKLTFTNKNDDTDKVTIQGQVVPNSSLQFTFKITDDSEFNAESNTATFSLIPQGNVNVVPIYTNTPPIVGDNTITLRYNEVRDFEQSDFVEDTDPEYYDPENDEPYELKVLTLPEYGQLLFNSSPVIVNQIISFIDIREGRFKYAADSSRTDIEGTSFLFAVSDIGTKQFSE